LPLDQVLNHVPLEYGYATRTLSINIATKKNSRKLEDSIRIPISFFNKRHRKFLLFPNSRFPWEQSRTDHFIAIHKKDALEKTIFNFDKNLSECDFDELLYGFYSRKVQLFTEDEALNIMCIRLKSFQDIIFTDYNTAAPSLSDSIKNIVDVVIYLLLKKSPGKDSDNYGSTVTLCALIEPAASIRKISSHEDNGKPPYVNTFINMTSISPTKIKFVISLKQASQEMQEHYKKEYLSVDHLMADVLKHEFIDPFNRLKLSKELVVTDLGSDAIDSYVLMIDQSKNQYTFDPLRAYARMTNPSNTLFPLCYYVLTLLYHSYRELPSNLFTDSDTYQKMIENVMKPTGVDSSIYITPYKNVTLIDVNSSRVLQMLKTDPINYDYPNDSLHIVASWDFLLNRLITSQSQIFFRHITKIDRIPQFVKGTSSLLNVLKLSSTTAVMTHITEEAIGDFQEFYDINIINSEGKQHFREQYELAKKANNIISYYETLKDKLEIYGTFQVAEEQRRLSIVILILTGATIAVSLIIKYA